VLAAQLAVVLAVSSKIGRQSLCRFADAGVTLGLITDGSLTALLIGML
jgi:hypothetical protein